MADDHEDFDQPSENADQAFDQSESGDPSPDEPAEDKEMVATGFTVDDQDEPQTFDSQVDVDPIGHDDPEGDVVADEMEFADTQADPQAAQPGEQEAFTADDGEFDATQDDQAFADPEAGQDFADTATDDGAFDQPHGGSDDTVDDILSESQHDFEQRDVHESETSPAGYESASGAVDAEAAGGEFGPTTEESFDAESGDDFVAEGEELAPEDDPFTSEEDLADKSFETSPAGYDEAQLPPEALADEAQDAHPADMDMNEDAAGYEDAPADDQAFGDESTSADDTSESIAAEDGLEAEGDEPEIAEDEPEEEPDEELVLQPEIEDLRNPPEPEGVDVEPLPEVGPYLTPAMITLYVDGEALESFAIEADSLLLGRPGDGDAPDIDISAYAPAEDVWNQHATIYRQNKNYTLYVTSDGATQLNEDRLDLGEHRELDDGDVVILGGEVGIRFELPDDRATATPPADDGMESGEEEFDEPATDATEDAEFEGDVENDAFEDQPEGDEAFAGDEYEEEAAFDDQLDEGDGDDDFASDPAFQSSPGMEADESDIPFE